MPFLSALSLLPTPFEQCHFQGPDDTVQVLSGSHMMPCPVLLLFPEVLVSEGSAHFLLPSPAVNMRQDRGFFI